MQKDYCNSAVDGASCEASSESTVSPTEGLFHHTKCLNIHLVGAVCCGFMLFIFFLNATQYFVKS